MFHLIISYNEMHFDRYTKLNHQKFLIVHNDNLKFEDQNSRLCISYCVFEGYVDITVINKYNYEYMEYSKELQNCLNQLGKSWDFIVDYIKT